MPRRKKDGPIISKISTRIRKSDGKIIYETTIPIPVGEIKGSWVIKISDDNIINYETLEQYVDRITEERKESD